MARADGTRSVAVRQAAEAVLLDDPGFLREVVTQAVQAILDAEMTAHLGAERYERSGERQGYRNGTKPRRLTRARRRTEEQRPTWRIFPELPGLDSQSAISSKTHQPMATPAVG